MNKVASSGRMIDTHRRAIAKAITYRFFGMVVTTAAAWLLTRETCLSICLGVLDTCVKLGGYYIHERLWELTGFGRRPASARPCDHDLNLEKEPVLWPSRTALNST